MIGLLATNGKLRARIAGALAEATGEDADTCTAALADAGGNGRVALLTLLSGVPAAAAEQALTSAGGNVREALAVLNRPEVLLRTGEVSGADLSPDVTSP
jgi:N-acetylmuramic acid 6-phosphate etherase